MLHCKNTYFRFNKFASIFHALFISLMQTYAAYLFIFRKSIKTCRPNPKLAMRFLALRCQQIFNTGYFGLLKIADIQPTQLMNTKRATPCPCLPIASLLPRNNNLHKPREHQFHCHGEYCLHCALTESIRRLCSKTLQSPMFSI